MFYSGRYRVSNPNSRDKIWEWQDEIRPPVFIGRPARQLLYLIRRYKHAVRHFDPALVAPTDRFLTPYHFEPVGRDEAVAWFAHVHRANEAVHQRDGSWLPQPYSGNAGAGVPIEEVALRIPGYLSAYHATGTTEYLDRALAGGEYLLRERVIPDGHVVLMGDNVCDWGYSLTGRALLDLWEHDRSRSAYLDAARAIGDRLMEEPITGSINHGSIPAQVLTRLYRHTGQRSYLQAALRRVRTRLIAFKQPAGDWDGHENRIWYQAVNLTTLLQTFRAIPTSAEYVRMRDDVAKTLIACMNNFMLRQRPDGTLPLTRYGEQPVPSLREMVVFEGGRFVQSPYPGGYLGHGAYEIDALVSANRLLGVDPAATVAHGYMAALIRSGRLWRLEFNTLGAGRYLDLIAPRNRIEASAA